MPLAPQQNSKRTLRRAKRNFKSLEVSTRKGRRATRRSKESRTVYGNLLKAGEKAEGGYSNSMHTAGGSLKFH